MKVCGKPAHDYRSMWVYGMSYEEKKAYTRCKRRAGHRGECSVINRSVVLKHGDYPGPKEK